MRKLMAKMLENRRYVFVGTALGMVAFGASKAFAFPEPVDVHVHDTAIESAQEDERNKEAFDKCTRGEAESVRDCERAEKYVRDHFSRHPDEFKMLNRIFLIRYQNLWEPNYDDWARSYRNTFE